jgi:hypothetical protein
MTPMTRREAELVAGSLSRTTKMPGASYGLPAHLCPFREGAREDRTLVCSDCYACKGNYQFENVKRSQERRWESLEHPGWAEAMRTLLLAELARRKEGRWFRWHDAGEIKDAGHLRRLFDLADAMAKVRFWLPMRLGNPGSEIRESRTEMLLQAIERCGGVPDNLAPRVSSQRFDELDPVPAELAKHGVVASMVVDRLPVPEGVHSCPAPSQGGSCGRCRACWSRRVAAVAYHRH